LPVAAILIEPGTRISAGIILIHDCFWRDALKPLVVRSNNRIIPVCFLSGPIKPGGHLFIHVILSQGITLPMINVLSDHLTFLPTAGIPGKLPKRFYIQILFFPAQPVCPAFSPIPGALF